MLTVTIIAKDEERAIRQCLESVRFAEEIIVLDSGSTDKTVEIAKEYTDKVYVTDWQGYGVQKQRALEKASGDWVLNLDADETVDDVLKAAIQKAMASYQYDAYCIPIRMCFYGKLLRFSSSPSRHYRLFKRAGASFSQDIVHEKVILPKGSRLGKISAAIRHNSFRDLSHALYKMNRYSSYSAKIRLQKQQASPLPDGRGSDRALQAQTAAIKEQSSLTRALFSSSWMFFRCYFLQAGFLDGKEGMLFAILNAQSSFYRVLKQVYPDLQIQDLPDIKDSN